MDGLALTPIRGFASRARLYFSFTRPFTLLPPTFGVVSGALTAFGSAHNPDPARRFSLSVLLMIGLGSLTAALLNAASNVMNRSEEHTSELQSQSNLVCRLLLEKKKINRITPWSGRAGS